MLKKLSFFLVVMIILAACGNEDASNQHVLETDQQVEESLQPLEVEILTESDAFDPGKEGKIEVKVSKGDEDVADADEVLFEIWKQGHEDASENFEAENVGKGNYSLNYTFEEDGIYYVIAHVTARDMHTMPKKEFKVGDVEADEHDDHGDHDHGDDSDGVSIHLMEPDTIVAGKHAEWTVHLEQDGNPLTEARVRFEYWKTDEEKHEFVKTTEGEAGEYTAELHFAKSGEYQLTVHVEKGELHEHKEETIEVQ